MMTKLENIQDILIQEYKNRILKNSNYSVGAFAKNLEIPVSILNSVFAGKQNISHEHALKIAKKLGFSPKEEEYFMSLLHQDTVKDERGNKRKKENNVYHNQNGIVDYDAECVSCITDWYQLAILELAYLDDFQDNPHWIAKKLGIDLKVAQDALDRLQSIELAQMTNAKGRDAFLHYRAPVDVPLCKFYSSQSLHAPGFLQKKSNCSPAY